MDPGKLHRNDQSRALADIDEDKPKKRPPAGPGRDLPHRAEMERAFGTGLGDVGFRVGADLGGERALAQGNTVAFADRAPDKKVVAHELAHVMQERGGRGGAPTRDPEGNADRVAERAVRGQPVGDMIAPAADRGQAHAYTEGTEEGMKVRMSESQDSILFLDQGSHGGQNLAATKSLVESANSALAGAGQNGSFIRLEATGDGVENDKGATLHKVKPTFVDAGADPSNDLVTKANEGGADSTGDTSDEFALWADCGRSSRTVMGTDGKGKAPKAEFSMHTDDASKTEDFLTAPSTRPAEYSDTIYLHAMKSFLDNPNFDEYLVEGVHYQDGDKTKVIVPTTGKQARAQFAALSADGQAAFSQMAKINEHANPEIGGAYTMATESDMPGYKKVRDMTWNFHWAGVIMKDGGENITLENYAIMFPKTGDAKKDAENRKRAYDWVNRDWVFQMYGTDTSKQGQTFHEQHLATGTHGTKASSFAAKVDKDPPKATETE